METPTLKYLTITEFIYSIGIGVIAAQILTPADPIGISLRWLETELRVKRSLPSYNIFYSTLNSISASITNVINRSAPALSNNSNEENPNNTKIKASPRSLITKKAEDTKAKVKNTKAKLGWLKGFGDFGLTSIQSWTIRLICLTSLSFVSGKHIIFSIVEIFRIFINCQQGIFISYQC
jgi:hypothetical protein